MADNKQTDTLTNALDDFNTLLLKIVEQGSASSEDRITFKELEKMLLRLQKGANSELTERINNKLEEGHSKLERAMSEINRHADSNHAEYLTKLELQNASLDKIYTLDQIKSRHQLDYLKKKRTLDDDLLKKQEELNDLQKDIRDKGIGKERRGDSLLMRMAKSKLEGGTLLGGAFDHIKDQATDLFNSMPIVQFGQVVTGTGEMMRKANEELEKEYKAYDNAVETLTKKEEEIQEFEDSMLEKKRELLIARNKSIIYEIEQNDSRIKMLENLTEAEKARYERTQQRFGTTTDEVEDNHEESFSILTKIHEEDEEANKFWRDISSPASKDALSVRISDVKQGVNLGGGREGKQASADGGGLLGGLLGKGGIGGLIKGVASGGLGLLKGGAGLLAGGLGSLGSGVTMGGAALGGKAAVAAGGAAAAALAASLYTLHESVSTSFELRERDNEALEDAAKISKMKNRLAEDEAKALGMRTQELRSGTAGGGLVTRSILEKQPELTSKQLGAKRSIAQRELSDIKSQISLLESQQQEYEESGVLGKAGSFLIGQSFGEEDAQRLAQLREAEASQMQTMSTIDDFIIAAKKREEGEPTAAIVEKVSEERITEDAVTVQKKSSLEVAKLDDSINSSVERSGWVWV